MEITRQADQFGLPERTTPPAPPQEHLAEQLQAPQGWQGPARLAEYGEVGSVQDPLQNYDPVDRPKQIHVNDNDSLPEIGKGMTF
jgi:hypothetical protein